MVFAGAALLSADVRTAVPPDPGPPHYSYLAKNLAGELFFAHDDEWAAVWFLRDPACIPPDFNLMDTGDFTPAFPGGPPRPFLCPMTVRGFAVWKNGPPPIDFVPIQESWIGLGAVPMWFVKLSEFRAAIADGTLTVPEILALPSLRKGSASVYEEVTHPGSFRPQGAGNGSIEVVAKGTFADGTSFQFEFREMGVKDGGGVSYVRHIRIAFR
jgi:hypothetical protein